MPSSSPNPSPAPIFNNPVQGGYGATYTYPYLGPSGFRASIYDRSSAGGASPTPRPSPTPTAPSSFQSRYFRYIDQPDIPPLSPELSAAMFGQPSDASLAAQESDLIGSIQERSGPQSSYPSPGGFLGRGYSAGYPAGTNMRNPGRDANGNLINPNGLYSLGRTQAEIDSIMRQNTNNVILGGVGSMAGIGQAAPGSQAAQFAANQRGVQLNNDMYGGRAINLGQPDELTMGPNRQMAYDPARDAQTARTTAEWRSGAGNRWRSNYGGLAGLAGSRGQPGGR